MRLRLDLGRRLRDAPSVIEGGRVSAPRVDPLSPCSEDSRFLLRFGVDSVASLSSSVSVGLCMLLGEVCRVVVALVPSDYLDALEYDQI